ncbi:class I SAM-dependent methyltransferase [Antrihabitans cavernicola]|uniref:Class I SAM-dependent methyltransferase n=1 Tax=Antrihabitans cavernicola TaxID=2495913 RepID=A0A5A7SCG4_9NOCA|nr:class I SAM-dependent methyltransferase [Spelaeibacter cavernicola]KAA0023838.1 class I SAM-dependent methyltransferase [Spelaeibacter cavernicola]
MTDTVESDDTHAGAQHFCRTLASRGLGPEPRVFVAGCGKGHEALFIRKELGGSLTGVDIGEEWDPALGSDVPNFRLVAGSVLDVPFPDNSFDVVFYHHVIEHVTDPVGCLRELGRVLRPGGLIYLGTPNRHRAVGYLGSFDASAKDKLMWNLSDYKARLAGRFHNELGAHAGFTEHELTGLMREQFTDIEFLTGDYLRYKYGARLPDRALRAVTSRALRGFAAPSVYAIARKS